jgi:membrane fusion protein (multidrug efflux system)
VQSFKAALQTTWTTADPKRRRLILGSLVLICISLFWIWHYFQTHISTDNAYVNANSIQIATQVSGPILFLQVKDNQVVKAGEPLFEIDPEPFQVAIEEATAQVSQAKAQYKNTLVNLERIENLVTKKFLSPEEKDNAATSVDVAAANLKLAEAKLKQAELELRYTKVFAPTDGLINHLSLRPGTNVQAQTPLFVLISHQQYWVDANFKETELTNIRPQQKAKITLDMYPDNTFIGVVDSISASTGTAFSLLPPQNATGNWVKVTQRIPVKVLISVQHPHFPLRVGATANVTIYTPKSSYAHP